MGFFGKLGELFNGPEDEEEEEGMEGLYGEEDKMDVLSKTKLFRETEDTDNTVIEGKRGNKVVNIHATAQLQVVLVKPERFDDASAVADHLNAKRTVVLNLESANKDVARRILDFLCGVAYANDGQIKKVANCTFIITPYNVGIMGDLLDELENNGLYF